MPARRAGPGRAAGRFRVICARVVDARVGRRFPNGRARGRRNCRQEQGCGRSRSQRDGPIPRHGLARGGGSTHGGARTSSAAAHGRRVARRRCARSGRRERLGLRRSRHSSGRLATRCATPGRLHHAGITRGNDDRAGLDDDRDRHHDGCAHHDVLASLRAAGHCGHNASRHDSSDDCSPHDEHGRTRSQPARHTVHSELSVDSSPVLAHADRACHRHQHRCSSDQFRRSAPGRGVQRSVEHLLDDAAARAELQRTGPILSEFAGPLPEHAAGHRPRRPHRIATASQHHVGRDRFLNRILLPAGSAAFAGAPSDHDHGHRIVCLGRPSMEYDPTAPQRFALDTCPIRRRRG